MNVRLLSNDRETPSTRRIRLALDGAPFPYTAGQAASLSAGGPATPYSIASAPGETRRHGWLEFLIKVDGSTRFGANVDRLTLGSAVELEGPAGAFTLERLPQDTPLLFIAGGTGVAPIRSMLREAIDAGWGGALSLVYSSRTPDEFAYLQELRELAGAGRLHLTLTLTGSAGDWDHARGRTAAEHFTGLLHPSTVAFVCGPRAMVTEVPIALATLGVGPDRVVTENW